jgi:hypothetical protein
MAHPDGERALQSTARYAASSNPGFDRDQDDGLAACPAEVAIGGWIGQADCSPVCQSALYTLSALAQSDQHSRHRQLLGGSSRRIFAERAAHPLRKSRLCCRETCASLVFVV